MLKQRFFFIARYSLIEKSTFTYIFTGCIQIGTFDQFYDETLDLIKFGTQFLVQHIINGETSACLMGHMHNHVRSLNYGHRGKVMFFTQRLIKLNIIDSHYTKTNIYRIQKKLSKICKTIPPVQKVLRVGRHQSRRRN